METKIIWQAIREKVCVKCLDGDGHGNCRLDPSLQCPLQEYLPLIVNAVNRVSSDRVADYVEELRGIVCAQCKYEKVNGACAMRKEVDCALDRYFPLVIEAIEECRLRASA